MSAGAGAGAEEEAAAKADTAATAGACGPPPAAAKADTVAPGAAAGADANFAAVVPAAAVPTPPLTRVPSPPLLAAAVGSGVSGASDAAACAASCEKKHFLPHLQLPAAKSRQYTVLVVLPCPGLPMCANLHRLPNLQRPAA